MARKRHVSRIAVMQVLFEIERRDDIDPYDALMRNADEIGEADEEFSKRVLSGILETIEELKSSVESYAPGWTYERMDPIARCVLLVGAWELQHDDDAPSAVIMNECIDIAKEYGSDESGKFVNGVLNAMAE